MTLVCIDERRGIGPCDQSSVYGNCANVVSGSKPSYFYEDRPCSLYTLRRVFVHRIIFPRQRGGHTSKPNPFMQDRYCSMVDWQSFAGSAALEKSMHSSRFDFSSLQTQHGYGYYQVSPDLSQGKVWRGSRRWRGRTFGLEVASEVAGAGGCAIGPAAGMAGWVTVSECRIGLCSRGCSAYE